MPTSWKALAAAAALVLALAADAGAKEASRRPSALGPHPDRQLEQLAAKIGQMLIVGFPGSDPTARWPTEIAAMIGDGRIGGVVLYAGNIRNRAQLVKLTAALNGGDGPPPFIAVDQEGGWIQRLTRRKGFRGLPSANSVAAKALAEACAVYGEAAAEMADLAINLNFGPVVDLNINPRNPAIGRLRRSYGTDPDKVAAFAGTFIAAHGRAGVLTAAKHFPGHGSAARDPHKRVVDITTTWQESELEPFATLIEAGMVDMVMVGHLIHPRFSDGDRPASLSRRTITGELRQRLGFDGLIITDDLQMDAITERYGLEDAAIMAIAAGADLLILANQQGADVPVATRVLAAVQGAVARGRIAPETIDRAHARIMRAKARLRQRPIVPAEAGCPASAAPAEVQPSEEKPRLPSESSVAAGRR